jgi:hypothetical protein
MERGGLYESKLTFKNQFKGFLKSPFNKKYVLKSRPPMVAYSSQQVIG